MHSYPGKGRRTITLVMMALLVALLALTATSTHAADPNPAPVQVFFLTEPEDDVLPAMKVIQPGDWNTPAPTSPMVTKISIAISADNTLVYYDHWEDGFANDIANPTATEIYANPGNLGGVQIWGDGNTANGAPPGFADDLLDAGDVIILEDNNIVVPNTATSIDWDGKDKIGGTNAIAVSRSLWASGSNSLFAWANAMYPTSEWGQEYTAPVGCNTSDDGGMFDYTAFSITAAYDGTVVQVDPEGDGTYEASVTLNEGDTYFDASSAGGGGPESCNYIRQGGKVRSTDPAKPIQVVLLTGDIGSSYGSRDLNLVPDAQLSSSYWIPVGNSSNTDEDVRLYIYNPEATTMYVRCDKPGTSTVLTIPTKNVNSDFSLADNQAGHCYAVTGANSTTPDTARKFTGLATVDTEDTGWDWAVPFIPESGLSNQALVGLGVGRDWTASESQNQNGSPLWVTPTCQTFFYVDWNNDGTPDKVDFNGDNDTNDANVDGLDETTSNTGFQVTTLKSVRLFDASDRDQTGAYIYTKTLAGNEGTGGCDFAAAWGEDPRVASVSRPGLDLGTIVVSLKAVETSKASNLLIDADNNGVVSPGDTLQYLITIENTGLSPVDIRVKDTIPAYTSYVANSTEKHLGSSWAAIPDDGSGTPFPLDVEPNGVLLGTLPIGGTYQVRFKITVNTIPAGTTVQLQNCARIAYGSSAVITCVAEDVTVPAAPKLTLDKTASPATYDTAGDIITYTYLLTNSGNVPLTAPYAVTDDKASVTCPQAPSPLPMGGTVTCTASYAITQADLNAGSVTNVATATAKYNGQTVTSNEDSETVTALKDPKLTLVKTTSTPDYDEVGEVIQYQYTATNSGNVTLTPTYAVSDDKTTVTCDQTPAPLEPGMSFACTASYIVTQADITAGSVTNVATATAMHDNTPVQSNPDTVTVPAVQKPALTLDKETTTLNYKAVGDIINYTYLLTNSGNVPLAPTYAVSDDKTTVTCADQPASLAPGASITCTASYIVTLADLNEGEVVNTATATAKYKGETVPSNEDTVTVPALQGPALTLEKSTTTLNYANVGDIISYSYKVTNSGNVSLSPPYAVTDNKIDDVVCPSTPNPLVPGAFITCTATYAVTQADINAGKVVNIAEATARHGSTTVTSNEDDAEVPAIQTPQLTLDKTATTGSYSQVGDKINYSYLLTNSGNVPLTTPYTVTDDKATVTCPSTPASLVPGASITCTATYTVTQDDLDAGSVVNTAQAGATYQGDPVESNEDTVTVTGTQTPALTLDKTTTTVSYDAVGDTISYSYKVTNSGNVSLNPLYAVADDKIDNVVCNQTPKPLKPGDFFTCTATYTVTQDDLDAGKVVNVAQASAMHDDTPVKSNEDSVEVPATQGPQLSLDKTTTTVNYDAVGDVIQYSYKVTNSGNVSLNPTYAVADDKATVICPSTPTSLAPGASITCTATYKVTQADLDAGSVVNIAKASAFHGANGVTSNEDTVTVPAIQKPALTLDKTTTTVNYDAVGDTISYSYKVTNSGNVTLEPPYAVSDNKIANVVCEQTPEPLLPGDFFTCTATYTVTQDDLDAGSVINVATATAMYDDAPVQSNQDTVTVPAVQKPALTLDKTTTTVNYDSVGDVIQYSYKVTNSGNVKLSPTYAVSDDRATVVCEQTPNPLLPGDFFTCTASYTVNQVDINTGSVTNTATATAMHGNATVTSNEDSVTVYADQKQAIEVTKTANKTTVLSGDLVVYTVEVKNNGNIPVTIATLNDNKFDDITQIQGEVTATSCAVPQTINVGNTYTCTFTAEVKGTPQNHVNEVTACNADATVCDKDDETVKIIATPALEVLKEADPTVVPATGGDVTFTITVNNIGGGEITLKTLIDDKFGNLNGVGTCSVPQTIAYDDSYQCTFTKKITGTPGGTHTNVVTATGTGFNDTPLSDDDDATVQIKVLPKIEVTKTAAPTSIPETGGDVTFTFTVKNTGAIPATITSLSDSVFGALTGDDDCKVGTPLAAGASCSFEVVKTLPSGKAGTKHTNVFTAQAEDEDKNPAEDDDPAEVTYLDVKPSLVVDKTASPTEIRETGGDVTYTFIVKNDGEVKVTITSLSDSVFDALTGDDDCKVGTVLQAGESCTFDATFTLAGGKAGTKHTNVFTAQAEDDDKNPVQDDDPAEVTYRDVKPSITVSKTANPTEVLQIGGPVEFTFVVTNNGTVPVTITSLTDDKFGTLTGDAGCKVGTPLAVGASCEFKETFNVPPGAVGSQHVNTFTAQAEDTEKNVAEDDDPAEVTYLDVLPDISVTKTANPTEVPETGGKVMFTFVVINNAQEPATITSLADDKFGALNGDDDCEVGVTLPVGGSCEFQQEFDIPAGDYPGSHVNLFTVKATDPDGNETEGSDPEEVIYTDVLPEISVTKMANPTSLPETGGDVTFTFIVTNDGTEAVTITSLVDNVFGTLTGDDDCKVGTPLAAGASCSFELVKTLPAGKAGTDHTNWFTAKAEDNDGNEATDEDPAWVTYNDVKPAIAVTKSANPTSVPVTGGNVTFTFTVKNTGTVAVTITSLVDDKFGTLTGDDDCKVGTPLAAGASCTFSQVFTVPAGQYPGSHVNVFTAKAVDAEQNEATAEDPAEVLYEQPPITNVCPAGEYSNLYTDILGIGMGSNSWHSLQKTLVIPNAANVVDLYGQLAAKEQGKANYVRFFYPNNTYVQVKTPTSPAPQHWAVLWYGADLDPAASIRGRWNLQPWGAKQHMPRAFLLYPTYQSADKEYVNVFETLLTADTQVHWEINKGWTPKRVITIDIPAPLAPVTFNVELALVDNDSDTRPIYLTVAAGGVSQTVKPTKPNAGQQLNLHTFTLTNVPAGTGQIVITIESPAAYTNGLGRLGGDSGAIVGVTANYECVDVQLP